MGHEALALHLIGNAEGRKAEILGAAREVNRQVAEIIAEGSRRARVVAQTTLAEVTEAMKL